MPVRNSPHGQRSAWYLHKNTYLYLDLLDIFLLLCARVSLMPIRTEFACEHSLPSASGFPHFGVPTTLLQPEASISVNSEALWTELNVWVQTQLFFPTCKNSGSAKLLVRILYYGEDRCLSWDEKDLAASTLDKVIMAEGIYSTIPVLENVVFSLSAL